MLKESKKRESEPDDNESTDSALITVKKLEHAKAKRKQERRIAAPSSDDPKVELRRLVQEHSKRTRGAVAMESMGTAKKARVDMPQRGLKKGDKIPCAYPDDIADEMIAMAKAMKGSASDLESPIRASLKKCPIYTTFLQHVYGFGVVSSAYLVAMIDIHHEDETGRQLRPSGLRRFCGYAVMNGKLERPTKGQKLGYSTELRTRIWQAFQAMRKNAAKCTNDAPYGVTTKYLDIWYNAKQGATTAGMQPGAADSKGRNKATDVFLLDLYTVWRSIEGLESWPSYYEQHVGEGHRGWHLLGSNGPQRFTVDAALLLAGDLSPRPLNESRSWKLAIEEAIDEHRGV